MGAIISDNGVSKIRKKIKLYFETTFRKRFFKYKNISFYGQNGFWNIMKHERENILFWRIFHKFNELLKN